MWTLPSRAKPSRPTNSLSSVSRSASPLIQSQDLSWVHKPRKLQCKHSQWKLSLCRDFWIWILLDVWIGSNWVYPVHIFNHSWHIVLHSGVSWNYFTIVIYGCCSLNLAIDNKKLASRFCIVCITLLLLINLVHNKLVRRIGTNYKGIA